MEHRREIASDRSFWRARTHVTHGSLTKNQVCIYIYISRFIFIFFYLLYLFLILYIILAFMLLCAPAYGKHPRDEYRHMYVYIYADTRESTRSLPVFENSTHAHISLPRTLPNDDQTSSFADLRRLGRGFDYTNGATPSVPPRAAVVFIVLRCWRGSNIMPTIHIVLFFSVTVYKRAAIGVIP